MHKKNLKIEKLNEELNKYSSKAEFCEVYSLDYVAFINSVRTGVVRKDNKNINFFKEKGLLIKQPENKKKYIFDKELFFEKYKNVKMNNFCTENNIESGNFKSIFYGRQNVVTNKNKIFNKLYDLGLLIEVEKEKKNGK